MVGFFQGALGYDYLGHWQDRPNNRNVEEGLVGDWLRCQGHDDGIVTKTLHDLKQAVAVGGSKRLYDANREVYERLRYGVKVKPSVSEQTVTVWLIDWRNLGNNHFAIAEEVTVTGRNTKRPDLVLYVNGVALGVLELKRSTVSVSEGIRQNLDSQKPEFIESFFATTQLVMAGNDTEGLRYSVIETPEKHWLRWKETDAHPAAGDNPLLRELGQLCGKERLLEIVHDFVVFDAGVKKICRHNQYFGVRAARENVEGREGGIIWHTQGSGKSLTMVWLAKWIREHVTDPRVLLITDRTELDEQIEQVFKGVGEDIHRTRNGANLVQVLGARKVWLICSLIHKFGVAEEGDVDAFVEDIKRHLPGNFAAKGEIYVFVDECHRTQSGKLHRAMRDLLPEAMLIGFTGTPLLKDHKRRSIETFGPYIHTYKYDIYRKMLAAHFNEPEEAAMKKIETFEKEVKKRFIDEPGRMKLLIVVDKLLTGFDAPSATCLYIDKHMQDHGLFQAICRVNRLDGEDKEYGYVIDYKDLFRSLEQSVRDYTGKAFDGFDAEDVQGLLKDRLRQGRERLEEAREAVRALCEPVHPPRDSAAYRRYFCSAESGNADQLNDNEPKRVALYKLVASLLLAYADLANEMDEAGYSESEAIDLKAEVGHYEKVREEVKLASGDYIDLKLYEPAMRHLLDTYIRADDSESLSEFDDLTLVELIVERGKDGLESALPNRIRKNPEAMAETIENNVRRIVIDEMAVNPKYYERMSKLLDALILQRKQESLDYKEYLDRIIALAKRIKRPETGEAVLHRWYRRQLRDRVPPLVAKWEPKVGERVADVRIRKMKTRWGTCNPAARRIWLNLELAKKPRSCFEYILVDEMVHLIERTHNDRFRCLMDDLMPQWRTRRDELNQAPLAHEDWTY